MKNTIYISLFCYLIFQVLSVIPEWNLDSAGEDLLGSETEKTFVISNRKMYDAEMTIKKRLTKNSSGITLTNLLQMKGKEEIEVEFDQVESLYHIFERDIICPKGKFHPYDATNNQELKPDNFVGENWDLRCYYHKDSHFFLVFYLNNGNNVNIHLTNDGSIYWYNGASIEKDNLKETYDFLLKGTKYSGDYQMVALVNEGNSLKLEYYAFTLIQGEQYPKSYHEKPIIDKDKYVQAYFKNSTDNNKYFYYFSYNDISDFKSGYSTRQINDEENYYFEVDKIETKKNVYPHFEFLDEVTIEKMNFLLNNKFLYYEMKSKSNSNIYYGIFDIELNKIIFNTKEKIVKFLPYSDMTMLAITKEKAYKICTYKGSSGCIDTCSNGYLLDVDGNSCGTNCPNGKLTFKPTGVCINKNECDSTYYIQSGTNCGLCRDIDEQNPYKLIGGTECLNYVPENAEIYISNLRLLKCKSGFKLEDNKCVEDLNCFELCKECSGESTKEEDQKCTSCIDNFVLDENHNCRCESGFEKKEKTCDKCNNSCKKYETNSCNCEQCEFGYFILNNRCEKCDYSCESCEIEATNCIDCNIGFFKENNKCYRCSECKEEEVDSCKCKSCNDGFYLDFYQCNECKKSCKTCESIDKCLSCKQFYYLENYNCSSCPLNTNCKTTELNTCKCASCNDNFFLFNSECIKCNDETQCGSFEDEAKCKCKECNDGFYKENYSCKMCNDNCLTCDGDEGEKNYHCLSCKNDTEHPKYLLIDENRKLCVDDCTKYNAVLNENKTACILNKKNDEDNNGNKGDENLLFIFSGVIGIAFIIITIIICKKICCQKDDVEPVYEMGGELMDKESH